MIMITAYFLCVLQCLPMEEWKWRDGTISIIQGALNIPAGTQGMVKKGLKAAHTSFAVRGKILWLQCSRSWKATTHCTGSSSTANINWFNGKRLWGIQMQFLINNYRVQHDVQLVGLMCIYDTIIHLDVKVMNVQRKKQGSNNHDSPWAKAHLGFTTQLLIWFGEYKNIELSTPLFYNTELLPI